MHVTVLSTGGTIASSDDAAGAGAAPTKSGAELLDAVPGLDAYATADVEEVAQVPSFEIDRETLERVGDRVAALNADSDVDAVVVTHGTDTLEETGFYLDAALRPSTPVVLTGAQRMPDEVSPDGPANLLAAFRAAAAIHERDGSGVFVAFNESLHAARVATKAHTSKLETFASPGPGPVATLDHAGVQFHRPPRNEADHVPATDLGATVHVVASGSGVDADLFDAAVDDGAGGIVLQATGLGNTTTALGRAVERTAPDLPVVVASRSAAGRTVPVYGSVGGGEKLREYGALFAGDLPAHKARLKLQLALAADGVEPRDVFETFEAHGD
ncbi:asparaginase [Halobium salinum]|uniref:L-asparaginase n=1 Tax=Halobium salinum TaxID=1364940 RepID=A0ABD5PEV7_9EURY|nr:asparaginase [Halobium salinum]